MSEHERGYELAKGIYLRRAAEAERTLADMTRQRDEAVKAFQRERAKVVRVESIVKVAEWCDARVVDLRDLRAALAAPDAPQAPVHDAEVAGEGSDGQRAGEGL